MKGYRVFSFSDRDCPDGPTGGPAGVNIRLYEANRKLKYFDKLINIFKDKILEEDCELTIKLNSMSFESYFIKLNDYYRFTDEDVYIFHDLQSVENFYNVFKPSKTMLVYHQQGSLYKEWQFFTGKSDPKFEIRCNNLMKWVFNNIKFVGFPSKGSIESIIESDPSLKEVVDSANKRILYNGCDCEENIIPQTKTARTIIDCINSKEIPSFITAATLNEAKGVERIPEYLSKIKEKYGELLWIVIGSGIKEEELLENVKKYDLESNMLWIKERIPHNDLLAIYQYTDFYILTHRFSIFDYATIEAMHYGNIPILTYVGGNKEMIVENSGIFINDLASIAEFDEFMENEDINIAREKNINMSIEQFSERAFLKGYLDVVEELIE